MPELKNYSKKYIYEPHKAPIADQKEWGCQIKGDGTEESEGKMQIYPKPMFDFNEQREYCINKMKEAYDVGLYGDDEKVMSGEWKKIFKYEGGTQVKDETNGTTKGAKRDRPSKDEEDGKDEGSDDDGEPDEKPAKKAAKTGKGQKKQSNLDMVVSRKKGK